MKPIEFIGGPLDGTRLCAASELRPLLMVIDYEAGKGEEATPLCYERRGDVYVFTHAGTLAAVAGFKEGDHAESQ